MSFTISFVTFFAMSFVEYLALAFVMLFFLVLLEWATVLQLLA